MQTLAEDLWKGDDQKKSIESKSWGRLELPEKYLWKIKSEEDKLTALVKKILESKNWDNFIVQLDDETILEIPDKFNELYESIEKSKYILELEDDWDDEGSPGYNKETWVRAIKLIYDYTQLIYDEKGSVIDAPEIAPGPDSSIDILWERDKYMLLLNIPHNPKELASFYGDDHGERIVKATFHTSDMSQGLAMSILHLL